MKSMVSVPACALRNCDRWPILLHIYFFRTGASFLTGSLNPNNIIFVSQWMWLAVGSTLIVYFGGSIHMS